MRTRRRLLDCEYDRDDKIKHGIGSHHPRSYAYYVGSPWTQCRGDWRTLGALSPSRSALGSRVTSQQFQTALSWPRDIGGCVGSSKESHRESMARVAQESGIVVQSGFSDRRVHSGWWNVGEYMSLCTWIYERCLDGDVAR